MPKPSYCPNPKCRNHVSPRRRWRVRDGSYPTVAHGRIQRYQCRDCGRKMSDQTESLHYFAKRHIPLNAVWQTLVNGASLRDIARRYKVTPQAIQNAVLRLGRQAMAAQLVVLDQLQAPTGVVYDGLRSFVTSQDFPCDITTVVDGSGETILSMVHSITKRGGTIRPGQRRRLARKLERWQPEPFTVTRTISLLVSELLNYLHPEYQGEVTVETDQHPVYARVMRTNPSVRFFRQLGEVHHSQTSGQAPRTFDNPLFPVNYLDRLLRHRLKEHTRETIAFGRHATMQMHRAWIFAADHNFLREYRVRTPELGTHAGQHTIDPQLVTRIARQLLVRRIRVPKGRVPDSIAAAWTNDLQTPPVRWKKGQKGTSIRIPGFAVRDLFGGYPQAA